MSEEILKEAIEYRVRGPRPCKLAAVHDPFENLEIVIAEVGSEVSGLLLAKSMDQCGCQTMQPSGVGRVRLLIVVAIGCGREEWL